MIVCRALSQHYGVTRVFNALDMEFAPGSTRLEGKNGSGKSSLLRLIAGLETPTRGTILGAHKVSLSSDGLQAPPNLSVHEVMALHLRYRTMDKAKLTALGEALSLTPYTHTQVGELSSGNLKKLSLALALAEHSDWLLLDEPLNALDSTSQHQVIQAIGQDPRHKIIVDHQARIAVDRALNLDA